MRRSFCVATGALALLAVGAAVFEAVPYSPLRSTFLADAHRLLAAPLPGGVFTTADLVGLPGPVRRHVEAAGFLGTPHVAAAIDHPDTRTPGQPDTRLELDGRALRVRYTQVNAIAEPTRWAFIDARLYGVPFQGLEGYLDGAGSMRGVLGKAITLFDEAGPDLDSGTLLTVLAEALVHPDIALADYVTWEDVDATHARATLASGPTTVSGVFSFGPDELMTQFRTEERVSVSSDGTRRTLPWSVTTGDYAQHRGIQRPRLVRAIWHEPEEDLVYFESRGPRYLTEARFG